jgi:DNA polymerase-3 subunit alpha
MFDMFGDSVATPLPALELVESEVSKAEMLAWERELLGVYVSEHPFTSAAVTVSKHTSALVSEITPELDGREVVIAGMVNSIRTLTTKAGKTFVAVTVEDLSGSAEVTVWPDLYDPTREIWQPGNILLMLVRVRERNDRLQAGVQQASLVQAADGTVSHEHFSIPSWLTEAVRSTAGVSVTHVEHDTPATDVGARGGVPSSGGVPARRKSPAPNNGTNGGARSDAASAAKQAATAVADPPSSAERRPAVPTARTRNGTSAALRFFLHESEHDEEDRARLDALIAVIAGYPGDDPVRIFIHARDGDRIELHLPDARACEDLRTAGIEVLGRHGGADPLPDPRKTRGVEPLEV